MNYYPKTVQLKRNSIIKKLNGKTRKQRVKELTDLWGEVVIARAGFKSELSGKRRDPDAGVYLAPHHIAGKPNLRLRFELKNGICLTCGEHERQAHGGDPEKFRRRVMELRGSTIYDELYLLRWQEAPDLDLVEIYLKSELKKVTA